MCISGEAVDAQKGGILDVLLFWSVLAGTRVKRSGSHTSSLDVDTARVRAATAAVTRARARVASVAVTAGVVRSARVAAVISTHVSTMQESDD